jgi:DNA-directed RNA polymerase specialized sigma24 family protein
VMVDIDVDRTSFEDFVSRDGARLKRALVARYGVDIGCDACAHALAWAWERWLRVEAMENAPGYLYRVGQTHATRAIRLGRKVTFPAERSGHDEVGGFPDPDLADALQSLSQSQRLAVLLVHAYGWSPADVSRVTGVPASTVRSNLRRGLRRLRRQLDRGDFK